MLISDLECTTLVASRNFVLFLPQFCSGVTYDISNKHRLGYSEVELVQKMIDGVNTLYKEDKALKEAHGI